MVLEIGLDNLKRFIEKMIRLHGRNNSFIHPTDSFNVKYILSYSYLSKHQASNLGNVLNETGYDEKNHTPLI